MYCTRLLHCRQQLILFSFIVAYSSIISAFTTSWRHHASISCSNCHHQLRPTGLGLRVFSVPLPRSALILAAADDPNDDIDEKSPKACVCQRLDLSDQFARWKFLQQLLDAEVSASDTNELLYRVLYSFITYPPSPSGESEDSNVSPIPTEEKIEVVESLFRTDENGRGSIFALRDPECSPGHSSVLQILEDRLLPDPREDEDAHKGTWDTIVELHGRESVKVRQQEGSEGWRARSTVARVLIYFDFLTRGVVEEPFS